MQHQGLQQGMQQGGAQAKSAATFDEFKVF